VTTPTQPSGTGSRLAIERLVLHVPPMREDEARRLAELVGRALRRWPAVPGPGRRIEAVQATVPGGASAPAGATTIVDLGPLADRIATAVLDAALREGSR
jgi:hypothetical protein